MKSFQSFIAVASLAVGLSVTTPSLVVAQKQQVLELELANEYFYRGDWAKAKEVYQKIAGNKDYAVAIFPNYLETLKKLNENEEAEKYLKRLIKLNPEKIEYDIELVELYEQTNRQDVADKYFAKFVKVLKDNYAIIDIAAQKFLEKKQPKRAETLYLEGRKNMKSSAMFSLELAEVYFQLNDKEKCVQELLNMVGNDASTHYTAQNRLQNYLSDEKEFELLKQRLLERTQKDPDNLAYNEMLLWLHLQQKEFYSAFVQAKAIDKRKKSENAERVMEVATLAVSNQDYESAIEIYEYVITQYPNSSVCMTARRNVIQAKEEIVKKTYPIDENKIRSLIQDYLSMLRQQPVNQRIKIENLRSVALLYGQYLNKTDTAIALLEEVLQLPNPDVRFINETKIMLGDMYLLKGEPWESTLLYSQVEKALKDQPLAHEAKLKNAKLSYYKGEFELAQEHLDILKMATSREIANDAMELSLLISDNTILDTSTAAMEEYAAIELLLFKNQDDEALKRLDKMLVDFPNHSLTDEIYFLQGKIFQKRKDFQAAIAAYEKVEAQKGIYSDDALFLQAQLYDFQFKNKEKAMELYQRILKDFQGSIYVVEARKRFRTLRGDANIPN